jgi:hypothetical protein
VRPLAHCPTRRGHRWVSGSGDQVLHGDELIAAARLSHSRSDLEVTPIFTKFQVVDFSGSDDFV